MRADDMALDQECSDETLVESWSIEARREEIFKALYSRYEAKIASFFKKRFSSEECPDLVQETFLHAYLSLNRFRREASFRTWLFRIAENVGRRVSRDSQAQKRVGVEIPIQSLALDDREGRIAPGFGFPKGLDRDDPLDRVLVDEAWCLIQSAAKRLPQKDRSMLACFFRELSLRETASELKIPEGTVKSRWARLRYALRRMMRSYQSPQAFC